ncbi:MAG: hypothetical protein GY901_14405, partial [Actinomycetia bacterium]|nr:hypothetical protein [Actinomycetes bacterium]
MTPTTTDPAPTYPTTTLAAEAARLEALDGGLDAVLEGFFAADHDAADHEAVADRAEVESPPVAVDPDEADI